ncbi:sensor histidine kinase [Salinadaptatus halalkaliphilus]|uniref:sensor histidine kinase n=1 Tax=Salinadaptatus halalkaliphilus TaxID=2419781 RepID=UPI001580092E|nr:PAS domain S-box protein [Salinadaptatus halalkaliphilus]
MTLVVSDDHEQETAVRSTLENAPEPLDVLVTDIDTLAEYADDAVDCLVCLGRLLDEHRDALEAITEHAPSLPVICWGMPERLGLETALEAGITDYVRSPQTDDQRRIAARRVHAHGNRYQATRAAATYRSIFERLPDAVVVHDATGDYERANERATELLGYDRSTLLEKSVSEIELTTDAAALESQLTRCDPGETIVVTGRNQRADGDVFPVRVNIRRLEADPDRFIASIQEITELKARERELERNLDLLEKMEELTNAGGWEVDYERETVRWTGGTRRLVGVDAAYEPTLETTLQFFHPDDRPRLESAVKTAIVDGEPFDEQFRLVTVDDRVRHVRVRGDPYQVNGYTTRVRGSIWDITDRKAAEDELRQREAHLSQAQSVAELGSWYKEIATDVIHWSDEVYEIYGIEKRTGPIDHAFFMEHVHPDDRELVNRKWDAAKRGDRYDVEHRIITGDGETKWVRQKAKIEFDDGLPTDATGVVQDVTDRKAYERRLEAQNEQLDVLNRIIRHDLRNQLNVIDGYAAVLEEHSDATAPLATEIRTVTEDLLEMAEEIRTANRLLVEGDDYHRVDVEAIVEAAMASVRDEYDTFTCACSIDDGLWVRGTNALEIALEQIVENAIEHNDAATPRVEISAEHCSETDTVSIRIADNGPGIPDSERELLTGTRERSQIEHSSGLGLWVVNWIVSSVEGTLGFETDDDGTVVTLELPSATDRPHTKPGEPSRR